MSSPSTYKQGVEPAAGTSHGLSPKVVEPVAGTSRGGLSPKAVEPVAGTLRSMSSNGVRSSTHLYQGHAQVHAGSSPSASAPSRSLSACKQASLQAPVGERIKPAGLLVQERSEPVSPSAEVLSPQSKHDKHESLLPAHRAPLIVRPQARRPSPEPGEPNRTRIATSNGSGYLRPASEMSTAKLVPGPTKEVGLRAHTTVKPAAARRSLSPNTVGNSPTPARAVRGAVPVAQSSHSFRKIDSGGLPIRWSPPKHSPRAAVGKEDAPRTPLIVRTAATGTPTSKYVSPKSKIEVQRTPVVAEQLAFTSPTMTVVAEPHAFTSPTIQDQPPMLKEKELPEVPQLPSEERPVEEIAPEVENNSVPRDLSVIKDESVDDVSPVEPDFYVEPACYVEPDGYEVQTVEEPIAWEAGPYDDDKVLSWKEGAARHPMVGDGEREYIDACLMEFRCLLSEVGGISEYMSASCSHRVDLIGKTSPEAKVGEIVSKSLEAILQGNARNGADSLFVQPSFVISMGAKKIVKLELRCDDEPQQISICWDWDVRLEQDPQT